MCQPLHVAVVGCVIATLGASPVSAQTPSAASRLSSRPAVSQAAGMPMKPFLRLFADPTPGAADTWRLRSTTPNLAPRQICGIKVIRPDPNIDRKFEVPLGDTSTNFTIRTVPMLCR